MSLTASPVHDLSRGPLATGPFLLAACSPTGPDRGVRLPLPPPPEPPYRGLRPQGPLPAACAVRRPPGPCALLRSSWLLPVLLPCGEWGGRGV